MKKVLSLLLIILLVFSLASCGSKDVSNTEEPNTITEEKNNEETTDDNKSAVIDLKEIPSGFVKGFEEAEFSKYNSFASENGLGETPIWVEGVFDDVSNLEADEYTYYYAIITDTKGNKWLVDLDVEGYGKKDSYTALCNHTLVLKGVYLGYSQVYEMPVFDVIGIFDRETGNLIMSKAYSQVYEDIMNSQESSDQPKEETQTQAGMRPEIKEAIDAYDDFMNTYCDFIESFDKSDFAMLAKYAELVSQYSEIQEQFDTLGNADLNEAELAYYTEVSLRCSARLLEVSSNLTSDMSSIIGSLTG